MLNKWRRIYRTVRIMAKMKQTLPVDVTGWRLPDGNVEVRLEITGITDESIEQYVAKIADHPGLTRPGDT